MNDTFTIAGLIRNLAPICTASFATRLSKTVPTCNSKSKASEIFSHLNPQKTQTMDIISITQLFILLILFRILVKDQMRTQEFKIFYQMALTPIDAEGYS